MLGTESTVSFFSKHIKDGRPSIHMILSYLHENILGMKEGFELPIVK